ncbi:L-2-hydroxyglutarate oxidase [Flavobacterium rhamnosiphilum]|uniref:L-2-hydroxyglutarate oxidase n=1 Tax=Flavobacterium rhamnosiphilum TaxID=2541724 RepID=A0A4V2Z8V2_9FLAO|nr:L-2-hydroxyglutarate oxidase [Flavobacterium rhamnosiphilum]TDE41750.1 L-2-hydroxyglutarate oxidase [Flavobacterium rhamnosiphilum]
MKTDFIIIGGGIVGLSTAYHLKKQNPELKVVVLEKESKIALHQTGHNSGVIHSGIYYKPGSLKAINCKRGYDQLIQFCNENEIKYDLCGKIIVATEKEELPIMAEIYDRGIANGLLGIKKISAQEIKEIEPYCTGIEGIWVPQTGIIDYKEVSRKYADLFVQLGGEILFGQKVQEIRSIGNSSEIQTKNNRFETKWIINCAGLYSDKVAKMTNEALDVQILPFRGEYFNIKKEKEYLVKNLIYPVPNPNFPFLGVHFTRMVHGGVEAGPNAVLAFAREGYTNKMINWKELFETLGHSGFQKVALKYWKDGMYEMYRSYSKTAFTKALQRLIPEIQKEDLEVGNAGVRAQACDSRGNLSDDFLIFEDNNVINVCNAPSPAATSSLAIGESIATLALKKYN